MSVKGSTTTCSGLDWNEMLGLLTQLKKDQHWQEYLLFTIGCYLGLRASDLLNLKWEDVLEADRLVLTEKKTAKKRSITINPNCRSKISFVWNHQPRKHYHRPDNYIFVNRRGKRISIQYVNRRLKWIFTKYRIKTDNASTHTLRKTFGRRVYEMNDRSENSLIMLSMMFSHSNVAITKRYLGITQEEIQDVYLNL